jgi:spermidine synthase
VRKPPAGRKEELLSVKGNNRIFVTLFFTGLLGIGYEVLCTRALAQVLENTIYTFALLLVDYLFGTALGAALYKRLLSTYAFTRTMAFLLAGLSISCAAGVLLLRAVRPVYVWTWLAMGHNGASGLLAEMVSASLVFLLPTIFMGALFSHLAQAAKDRGYGLGRALAVNTLGGALAPFLFGILLLPGTGIRAALMLVALGYCILIPTFKNALVGFVLAGIPITLALLLPWRPVDIPEGSRLLAYREGIMSSASVLEAADSTRSLKLNNKFYMGSTAVLASERRKAHLPLLLHSAPKSALFLGLGTGITFGAAKDYPDLRADAVELDAQVVALIPYFSPGNRAPYESAYHVYTADARRFVRSCTKSYDVIVAGFFHPARDGAGTLYTLEHFTAIRSRLNKDGIYCQWLPLYQLDLPELKVIVNTFLQVFPHTRAFLGSYSAQTPGLALIGRTGPWHYSSDWFTYRVRDDNLRAALQQEALSDNYKLFTFFFGAESDLRSFVGGSEINTDNHPVVMYRTPGFTGEKSFTPYGRLEKLMALFTHHPGNLIEKPMDEDEK